MEHGLQKNSALNLRVTAIEKRFAERGFIKPEALSLHCLMVSGSTNEEIKRAIAAHEQEGTVYTSLEQWEGYGRQGRPWSSPLGGLYLSLLLRPEEQGKTSSQLPTLSLVVSIAVRRTLLSLGLREDVLIKWPNDIVCGQGKLSGISVEVIEDAVCVGIGMNLFQGRMTSVPEGKHKPAYVAALRADRGLESSVSAQGLSKDQRLYMEDVVTVLLNEVFCIYNQWLVEGFSPFRDEYRTWSSLHGQFVQLVSLANDILHEGMVCDVDMDGYLCLMKKDGTVVHAHSGEAHLR